MGRVAVNPARKIKRFPEPLDPLSTQRLQGKYLKVRKRAQGVDNVSEAFRESWNECLPLGSVLVKSSCRALEL